MNDELLKFLIGRRQINYPYILTTNSALFHNFQATENLLLKLPLLSIDGLEMKQVTLTKFLGVKTRWKHKLGQQSHFLQNEISKNLGIAFNGKNLFGFKSLLSLYYSFDDEWWWWIVFADLLTNERQFA